MSWKKSERIWPKRLWGTTRWPPPGAPRQTYSPVANARGRTAPTHRYRPPPHLSKPAPLSCMLNVFSLPLIQVQTRSADEPMTTFVFCNGCGNRWKVSYLTQMFLISVLKTFYNYYCHFYSLIIYYFDVYLAGQINDTSQVKTSGSTTSAVLCLAARWRSQNRAAPI